MAKPLNEQVVVITGASSGIGRETALRLASKGAKVVVSARREEPLEDLVEQISSQGGEAFSVPADVSAYKEVEALAQEAVNRHGRIDTWVNNAGIYIVGEFEKTGLDEAHRQFDVNFWGEFHGCKAVLPIMRRQGSGTIVNISSVTAKRPLPLTSVYSASKAAINGMSEALRAELQGSGIELCIVMPATIDTPLFEHARSKEGLMPKAVPPIYPPSEVASAIELAATSPKKIIYAGPAGQFFSASNIVMGDVLDKFLGTLRRPLMLSNQPEKSRGHDNVDEPWDERPATRTGGWRGRRYRLLEAASRIAVGVLALFLVRRLAKR